MQFIQPIKAVMYAPDYRGLIETHTIGSLILKLFIEHLLPYSTKLYCVINICIVYI